MRIVIPVSHVDLHLAELMMARINKLGGLAGHELTLVITMQAYWDREKFAILASQSGAESITAMRLPTENEEGWPESANHLFYSTVMHLATLGNTRFWYFMEADNVPLFPGWADALEREYLAAGKSYMGVINDTTYRNTLTGATFIRGKHMVGTGIYPADFAKCCQSVHYMDRRPFDICIEEEVVPKCHNTRLICHRWGTVNYRAAGDVIIMDDRDSSYARYAAPVSPEAVVVHGCKDASLYKLLDSGLLAS